MPKIDDSKCSSRLYYLEVQRCKKKQLISKVVVSGKRAWGKWGRIDQ